MKKLFDKKLVVGFLLILVDVLVCFCYFILSDYFVSWKMMGPNGLDVYKNFFQCALAGQIFDIENGSYLRMLILVGLFLYAFYFFANAIYCKNKNINK
ncbi:hypothetical protein FACS189459_0550 [Bacilli bacterium]|nr:hypothetical protein FACS189459_0550 [Bacilli bacterium]